MTCHRSVAIAVLKASKLLLSLLQFASAFLGEHDKESRLCVRHRQVPHRRLLSVGRRSDVHGQLLNQRPETRQRLTIVQAAVRQRHSKVQELGRSVRAFAIVTATICLMILVDVVCIYEPHVFSHSAATWTAMALYLGWPRWAGTRKNILSLSKSLWLLYNICS